MRIGCLQFAPRLGDVDKNLDRADAILSKVDLNISHELDLLVLPEMAFTGSNFGSGQAIVPYLEPSAAGITSLWARTAALKYGCTVMAGYPEKVDMATVQPTSPEYYSASIIVSPDGDTIGNYSGQMPDEQSYSFSDHTIPYLGKLSVGQCADLGQLEFSNSYATQMFARHALKERSNVVVLSMAWETTEEPRDFSRMPNEPDMDSLTCWVRRLEPLIRVEGREEVIVVLCNRTGAEGTATYAGTSAVLGIKDGEVLLYGILGRSEKDLLVVDTNEVPIAKLVYRPDSDGDSSPLADKTSTDGTEAQFDEPTTPNAPDKSSEAVAIYDSLEQRILEEARVGKIEEMACPKIVAAVHRPEKLRLNGQPVRPRVIIPTSNFARAEEMQSASTKKKSSSRGKPASKSTKSAKSTSSSGTVRALEASTPYPGAGAPWREHWPKHATNISVSHVQTEEPATPITPFEDLEPMSAAGFWPSPGTIKECFPRTDQWSTVMPVKENILPVPSSLPRSYFHTAPNSQHQTDGGSTRPDTPAVSRRQFQWPRSSQYSASTSLRRSMARRSVISERPESPKSRNASSLDLRQQAPSAMSSDEFSAAAKQLENIAQRVEGAKKEHNLVIGETMTERTMTFKSRSRNGGPIVLPLDVDEGQNGAISILASPSILKQNHSKERYCSTNTDPENDGLGRKALRHQASTPNLRRPRTYGSRGIRAMSPERQLPREARGRRAERFECPGPTEKVQCDYTLKDDEPQRIVQKPSGRTKGGTLRRVQSQQVLRNASTDHFQCVHESVASTPAAQLHSAHSQRRQRSSSQGVLPASARRNGITSWPISSENLRLSASMIHKRLIESFAKEGI